jgi:hypothetical protein
MVAAAGLESGGVEAIDRGTVGGTKRDVHAGGRTTVKVQPQCRFVRRTEPRTRVVLRTQHMAKRAERSGVEARARVQVFTFNPI